MELRWPAPLDADGKPISPVNIKAMVSNMKQMKSEHNADGEIWRWQQYEGDELERICNWPNEDDR